MQASHWAHNQAELQRVIAEALGSREQLRKFSAIRKWAARTQWNVGVLGASVEIPAGWLPTENPDSFVKSHGKIIIKHATQRAVLRIKCAPAPEVRVNPDDRKRVIGEYVRSRSPKCEVHSGIEIAGERNTVVAVYKNRRDGSQGGVTSVVHAGVEHHLEWEAARGFETFATAVLATLRWEAFDEVSPCR